MEQNVLHCNTITYLLINFKKAGFIENHNSIQILSTANFNISDENCTENDENRLTRLVNFDNMGFNDFVDDEVTMCNQWNNNDIIDQMKASCEAEEKDEEIGRLIPNVTKLSCSEYFEEI